LQKITRLGGASVAVILASTASIFGLGISPASAFFPIGNPSATAPEAVAVTGTNGSAITVSATVTTGGLANKVRVSLPRLDGPTVSDAWTFSDEDEICDLVSVTVGGANPGATCELAFPPPNQARYQIDFTFLSGFLLDAGQIVSVRFPVGSLNVTGERNFSIDTFEAGAGILDYGSASLALPGSTPDPDPAPGPNPNPTPEAAPAPGPNPNPTPEAAPAPARSSSLGVSGIFLVVNPALVGKSVEVSPIYYGAQTIQPNSTYTLSVQSVTNAALTRTILDSGTVNARGHLYERALLGALNPGSYKIVMTGIHASGYPLVLTNHITVGANGSIISVSAESQQPFLN
jgi:hypothetical protein